MFKKLVVTALLLTFATATAFATQSRDDSGNPAAIGSRNARNPHELNMSRVISRHRDSQNKLWCMVCSDDMTLCLAYQCG